MVDMQNKGPFTQAADELHAMKYRGRGENFREYANRCAFALADNGAHYQELRPILMQQRFLPGGRIQGAAGATRRTTMYNCFVSGPIEDNYVEGVCTPSFFKYGSIMARATEAAATMRMGGGIGYNFSKLRPRGFPIMKIESEATGPVSFMGIFNAVGLATSSTSHRRGAEMGVLDVEHPDIEEFVRAKQNATELKAFNISVGVTDAFMEAALNNKPFTLQWGGTAHKEIDAAELWEKIMRSTWDWADPGVLFLDTINRMNNLWYCEHLNATNPCFTGDTKVWTATGPVRFDKLARSGKPVLVLTQLADGKLAYRQMTRPRMTQRKAELVEVKFRGSGKSCHASYTTVRCTPEHVFFMADGSKRKAKDLRPKDRIMSAYRSKANRKYTRLTATMGADNVMEHHLAAEVKYGRRPQWPQEHGHHGPAGQDVNLPENIEILPASQHNADHMRGDSNPMRRFPEKNHFKGQDNNGKKNGHWRHDVSTRAIEEMRRTGKSFRAIADKLGVTTYMVMTRLGWRRPAHNHTVVSVTPLTVRQNVYCGTVKATGRFFVSLGDKHKEGVLVSNCGEQPLPPYGACLLGSFNLVRYLKQDAEGKWYFDYRQFEYDVPLVVRAMDNVVDRSLYPLPQQEIEAKNKRRMGLGVTGLANAGEACAGPYGSAAFLEFENKVLETLLHASYRASVQLAKEKGPFPLFDADKYLQGQFILGMPDDIRGGISMWGIRNSHLTSIAPTGTISMCADNVSSAIEPTFARSTQRPVNTVEGIVMRNVDDFGAGFLDVDPKVTTDVTAAEHVAVLCAAQRHVDSAVSKTCNVTGKMPWADFKGIYRTVWENGGKGCTTFNQDGQRGALLTDGSACEIGPDGRRDCN